MAQNLPHLPDWEQVSTNIIRIMGGNPSKFTLQGTNTYLLGSGASRILIDTGSGEKKWIDTVRVVLNSATAKPLHISTCLLTHWHHDHLGGVTDLERLSAELNPGHELKVYKNLPAWNPDSLIDPSRVHDIHDGQEFVTGGGDGNDDDASSFAIQAIHTPGHAKDHMVFQITQSPDASEIGALFTADNVLGHGTAVFEDLQLYLQSLDVMKRRVVDAVATQHRQRQQDTRQSGIPDSDSSPSSISGGPNSSAHADANADAHVSVSTSSTTTTAAATTTTKRAYPGHGQVIDDAVGKIDEYIAHRRMREEEALNVLKYGTVNSPQSTTPVVHDSITTTGKSEGESDASAGVRESGSGSGPKEVIVGKEWDSMEMVRVIYRHYPENLWEPAEKGLLMVLEKLKKDGRVVCVGASGDARGKWRVSEKATL
ncbi:hypothetical protein G647_04423 [Cladophialophora carrionii CBS 160.54]|uniref:Metallo-beta-lactamase domain-containing protein n=1 Tax=Cladophialophora carrionii CBS 160.54 TaxID=1279043 RepID=V9DFE3_9EURO|nr:uncharacterized protein G647_04423 [Cladophialophora carrionii CBS 160.54]ETI25053.1 hypothetical protein G647_04423 [Cladophialophora carrionii CBS 160.54]